MKNKERLELPIVWFLRDISGPNISFGDVVMSFEEIGAKDEDELPPTVRAPIKNLAPVKNPPRPKTKK